MDNFPATEILASLAYQAGAKFISVHSVSDPVRTLGAKPNDIFKRGRPVKHDVITLSCYSCFSTRKLLDEPVPGFCQQCGSTRIRYRLSDVDTQVFISENPDPVEIARAVFPAGLVIFPSIVRLDNNKSNCPANPVGVPDLLLKAARFALYSTQSPQEAVYCIPFLYSILLKTKEERITERIDFLQKYYRSGGKKYFSLLPPENDLDECDLEWLRSEQLVPVA